MELFRQRPGTSTPAPNLLFSLTPSPSLQSEGGVRTRHRQSAEKGRRNVSKPRPRMRCHCCFRCQKHSVPQVRLGPSSREIAQCCSEHSTYSCLSSPAVRQLPPRIRRFGSSFPACSICRLHPCLHPNTGMEPGSVPLPIPACTLTPGWSRAQC